MQKHTKKLLRKEGKRNIRFWKSIKRELQKDIKLKEKQLRYGAIKRKDFQNFLREEINGRSRKEWIEVCNQNIKSNTQLVRTLGPDLRPPIYISLVLSVFLIITITILNNITFVGYVTKTEQHKYTDELNIEFSKSGEYYWIPKNKGTITSMCISGEVSPEGSVKVYLVTNKTYLIFNNKKPTEEEKIPIGLVISELNISTEDNITEKSNTTREIELNLNQKETTTPKIKAIEVKTKFNWNASQNNLCTKFEIYSKEKQNTNIVCQGSEYCCKFIELKPISDKWNNTFYLNYGRYGTTFNNIISAKIIFVNYSLNPENPFIDIITSNIEKLNITFQKETIKFREECMETWNLPKLDETTYKIIFEINNSRIKIKNITYTIEKETTKKDIPPELIKEIPDITIEKNREYGLDLKEYFKDRDNDSLSYWYNPMENAEIIFNKDIATIIPKENFTGTEYTFIRANDSFFFAVSNVFKIEITEKGTDVTKANISEKLIKPKIIINKPVKWVKIINVSTKVINLTVNISNNALNVSVKEIGIVNKTIDKEKIKVNDKGELKDLIVFESEKRIKQIEKIEDRLKKKKKEYQLDNIKLKEINKKLVKLKNEKNKLTGYVIAPKKRSSLFSLFGKWFEKITGLSILEKTENKTNTTSVIIEDIVDYVAIEYYTEAPISEEENITNGKRITIYSDVHYENITAYTYINDTPRNKIRLYQITNGTRTRVKDINYYDKNNNGLIDYIEWIVPHLSNQTYELIIEISKAEHLDENRTFIEDVYDYVKSRDNNYTLIPSGHYLRVTFYKNLTSDRDITIYARSNETASIEVYVRDGNETIARFENINKEGWYKVYLTNLTHEQDTFDLKVLGGVEIDYVVDPSVISTSTTTNALWTTKTHSLHYANGYYWIVFHNGNDVVIYSSIDGTSWTSQGVVSSLIDTEQSWAVAFDNTDIIVSIGDNSANLIYYRHGTLNNDGTVSWGSEQQVDCDGSADQYNFAEISGSKPLIGGLHGYNNVAPRVYVGSSITDSPSFSEETPSAPPSAPPYTSSPARSPTIIKSGDSDGDFSVFAGFVHTGRSDSKDIQINTYDASTDSWEGWETIVDDDLKNIHPPYKTYDVARDNSGNLHLLYIDLSGNINHKKGTAATPPVWSTISSDVTGLTSHTMLSVTSDNSGNIYLFYDKGDNGIYYRIYDGSNWGNENVLKGADSNTLQSITTSRTVDSNGEVLVAWVEGSSSPYNIRFGKAHYFSSKPTVRVVSYGTLPGGGTPYVTENAIVRNSKGHIAVFYHKYGQIWAAYYNGSGLPTSENDWYHIKLIGNTSDTDGIIANVGLFSYHHDVFIRNDILHFAWNKRERKAAYSWCNVSDDMSAIATTSNWKKADGTQGYDTLPNSLEPGFVSANSNNNPIVISTIYNRITRWNGTDWDSYYSLCPGSYNYGSIVVDGNDMVHVACEMGGDIYYFNTTWENAKSSSGWGSGTIICNKSQNFGMGIISVGKNNNVYVLCDGGGNYLDTVNWKNVSGWQEGTDDNSGHDLIVDFIRSNGGLWGATPDGYIIILGSQHTGVARQYNNRETPPFRTLNYYYGDPEDGFDSPHCIERFQSCDSDELLWVASNGSGVYLFKFETSTGNAWWCSPDTSPPNITAIAPADEYIDTDGNITFKYNTTDDRDIDNCSLVINNKINKTDKTITKDMTQTLNIVLTAGRYTWQINCSDGAGNENSSLARTITIIKLTGFNGTNLSNANISNITNFYIEKPNTAKINFTDSIDLSSGADIDTYVNITHNYVEINSSALPQLNKSATIEFYGLTYLQTPIILRNGEVCTSDICKINSYNSGNLSFNVSSFTSYSSSSNSNLTIWDDTDSTDKYTDEKIYFYANYTNLTSGKSINGTGVYCNISFDVTPYGPFEMIFNSTSLLYEYNRSFSSGGIFNWNVSCNGSSLGYEPLNASDDIEIFSQSQNIDSCQELNQANTIYTLTQNVSTTGTCFNITAYNVTLDCQGHWINYSYDGGNYEYGVYSDQNYTIIKNCNIVEGLTLGDYDFAIYFDGANNGIVENNTIITLGNIGHGVYLNSNSNNNNINNNNIITFGCTGYGIDFDSNSNNNNINNNTITTSGYWGYGIRLSSSSNSNINNNTITTSGSSAEGIYLFSSSNSNINNNTITTSGYWGYGIHLYSSSNNTLNTNTITTSGYGGHGILLYSNSDNNNLNNNTITTSGDFGYGIYLRSSSNNSFNNNTITTSGSSAEGIYLSSHSDNNNLNNNTITTSGSSRFGIDSSFGIYLALSSNNTLTNNSFETSAMSLVVSGSSSSYYNHNIDESNLAKGKPIKYYFNISNQLIENNNSWGELLVTASNNVTIKNITLNVSGILLGLTQNSTIAECDINVSGYGIYFYWTSNLNVENNTITTLEDYSYGLYLDSEVDYTNITQNNITTYGNNSYGIYFGGFSWNNTIKSNRIKINNESTPAIHIVISVIKDNTFYDNIFNITSGDFVYFGAVYNNTWNTTKTAGTNIIGGSYLGGNYWGYLNNTGYSDTCNNTDNDDFCDDPLTLANDNVDYLPLTIPDYTPPTITLIAPANNTLNTTTNTIDFYYNVTDQNNVDNCSLIINNKINKTDTSITKDTTQSITVFLENDNYNWSINCTDTFGNTGESETRNISINAPTDTQAPTINLISPANNTLNDLPGDIDFYYNVSDLNEIVNCSLIINNKINKTAQTPERDTTQSITTNLISGNYNWSINCTDIFGNENSSEWRNITINTAFINVTMCNATLVSVFTKERYKTRVNYSDTLRLFSFKIPTYIYCNMTFEASNDTNYGCLNETNNTAFTVMLYQDLIVTGNLTIEPGVTIKFNDSDDEIIVKDSGNIFADGNSSCFIIFTSKNDNSSGAKIPTASRNASVGDYKTAIRITGSAAVNSIINFTKIFYADTGLNISASLSKEVRNSWFNNTNTSILLNENTSIFNNLITNFLRYGVKIIGDISGNLFIKQNTFDNLGYGYGYGIANKNDTIGIYINATINNGALNITDNLFTNLGVGIYNKSLSSQKPPETNFNAYYNVTNNTINITQGINSTNLSYNPYNRSATYGLYFLNQSSYAVDNGSRNASEAGLDLFFTGEKQDSGIVDIGFHYAKSASGKEPVTPVVLEYLLEPYVMAWNETAEKIHLRTNLVVNVTIEYGLTQSYGSKVEESTLKKEHELTITGLTANTQYYYKVIVQHLMSNGTILKNDTFNSTFKTADNSKTSFSFAILGDTRGDACGELAPKFKTLIDEISKKGVDFIVMLGDDIRADISCSNDDLYWENFHNITKTTRKNTSMLSAIGNHEDPSRSAARISWRKYWIHPVNGNGTQDEWNETTFYWRYGNSLFIFLNTEETTNTGNISGNQFHWFNQTLRQGCYTHKFVFAHRPLVGSNRSGTLPIEDKTWSETLDNLMYNSGVTAAFYGHNHNYCYNTTHNGDMLHITTGGGGAPLYSDYCAGLMETQHNYIIVNVSGNSINGTVYNETGNVIHTFSRGLTQNPTYSNFQNNATADTKINGVVNWSINLSDNTGLDYYRFAHNQSGTLTNVSLVNISGTNYFANYTLTVTLSRGNYICGQFWFNDSCGNINQTGLSCFTVANSIPSAPNIIYPVDGQIYSSIDYINYSSIDADNDVITYYGYINNSLNFTTAVNITYWNASSGYYVLNVSAYDGYDYSGNSSISFGLDTTAPTISAITDSPDPQGYGLNVTIKATVNDNDRDTVLVEITKPDGSSMNYTMDNVSTDYYYNYTTWTNGTYSYKIYANDTAGNWIGSSTYNFDVLVNLTMQLKTLKDFYKANEIVNLTNITAAETNQSKLQNNGTTNTTLYLLLQIQKWNGSAWNETWTLYNSTAPIIINNTAALGNIIAFDKLFNGKWNTTKNGTSEGYYRAYAAALDNESNVLADIEGYLNATYNFTIDTTKPDVTLNKPTDGLITVNTNINFNWTVTDNLDTNLTCNITINGTVNVSNIPSLNGSFTNYTVHNFSEGDYIWNVTCWDDAMNVNVSETRNFSVDTSGPIINDVSASPTVQGYGFNITIRANSTDRMGVNSTLVEITPPGGTPTNYTMNNTIGDTYEYNYTGWKNGTYTYKIYSNDSGGHWEFSSVYNFEVYNDNITVQIRTLRNSYKSGQTINLTDPPGEDNLIKYLSKANTKDKPNISNAYVKPTDVRPGDKMLVSADIYDPVGIRKVTAEMPHEKGIDVLNMELVEGDKYNGTWQNIWNVHDTLEKNYTTIIRAENELGKVSKGMVGWRDSASHITYYNYSITIDKSAYENLGIPNSPSDYDSAATSGDYSNLAASDNSRWNTTLATSDGEYDSQIFIFNISETIASITGLKITWEGYGEIESGYYTNISFWNWTAEEWYEVNATDFTSATDMNITGIISSGISDFINSSTKQVAVLVTTKKYVGGAECGNGVIEGDEVCDNGNDNGDPCVGGTCVGVCSGKPPASGNCYCTTECVCTWGFCGFCPFFYSWNGSEYVYDTQIIYKLDSKEKETLQYRNISYLDTSNIIKGVIKEEEFETSYIDLVYLEVTDYSEDERIKTILKPIDSSRDLDLISESDDRYLITNHGDEVYVEFENAPALKEGFERKIKIVAEGYYIKYDRDSKQDNPHNSLYTDFIQLKVTYSSAPAGITYNEFKNNKETTNLSAYNLTTNTNISNLILAENTGKGKIKFLKNVTINNSFNLDSAIKIDTNNISVDVSLYPTLNVSAELTMKVPNVGYPKILKNNIECSDCTIISWDPSIKQVTFNVTGFSDYTAAEANQSKVQNNGTNNISFYLLMKTEYWDGSSWNLEDIIINDSASGVIRRVNTDSLLKLDTIWNAMNYSSDNLSNGEGKYRAYVALTDSDGNILSGYDGNSLLATFNFTFDNSSPYKIDLNYPSDDAIIPYNTISFNWTVYDNIDTTLTCNLTIDSIVEASNIQSNNGTMTNYTITNLAEGDHLWNITCWDDAMNVNVSETRNFSIRDTIAPTWKNISTNASNSTKINYEVWFAVNWSDNKALNTSIFSWNGTNGTWQNFTQEIGGLKIYIHNITKVVNLTRDNVIGYMFYANDSDGNINFTPIYIFKVNNTPPTSINLSYPKNSTSITNTTPRFNWTNATDPDNDTIYYDLFIRCIGGCSVDNREIYNLTDTNYTPKAPLEYYSDDNYHYEWWVVPHDNTSYAPNSSKFNFSIQSLVQVSLPTNKVEFGTLEPNQQNDTTDDNPPPIIIQNDGNCYINVNITTSSPLWSSIQKQSKYFMYKIDNVSSEKGAFNYSASATTWTYFNQSINYTSIYKLNYSDARDSAELDINITVPPNEPPGNKSTSIIITGYYVKIK